MDISKRPNIIILISDALRPKDLSLYGRKEVYDEKLKQIASENIVFMNNFSASTGSDPSVTSLFSGKYPTSSGFIHQHPFMRDEEVSQLKKNKFWLPLYLQRNGYNTISATPLHLWFKKGFNFYSDKESLKSGKFLDKPFVKRILLSLPNWAYSLGKSITKIRASPQFYSCEEVINLAEKELEKSKGPFFLFMHLVDTHYPYPAIKIKKSVGDKTVKEVTSKLKYAKQKEYVKKRFFDLNATTLEQIELKRDDSISFVDGQIKRFYDFLKKKSLFENTLIFILSDHGDSFGEHDSYFCRGGLYEESVHVPLIAHIPGTVPKKVEDITQTIDISATILDILGEEKYRIDGKSLIPLIKNGKKIRNEAFFVDAFCGKRVGAICGEKKVIFNSEPNCYLCGSKHCVNEIEEYNLNKDKFELNDLCPKKEKWEKFLARFLQ